MDAQATGEAVQSPAGHFHSEQLRRAEVTDVHRCEVEHRGVAADVRRARKSYNAGVFPDCQLVAQSGFLQMPMMASINASRKSYPGTIMFISCLKNLRNTWVWSAERGHLGLCRQCTLERHRRRRRRSTTHLWRRRRWRRRGAPTTFARPGRAAHADCRPWLCLARSSKWQRESAHQRQTPLNIYPHFS